MNLIEAFGQLITTGPPMGIVGALVLYGQFGLMFLAYLIADDLRNGRTIQRRDLIVVLVWPLFIFVCLIIGMAVFSDLTSKNRKRKGGGTGSILDALG